MPEFASLEGKPLSSPAARAGSAPRRRELARAGATVVVGYRSGADEAEAIAARDRRPRRSGRRLQRGRAKRLVEEAGDLDVLVNNAGITRDGLLARMSDDDWRSVLETNLSSVFYTCRAVRAG